MIKMIHSTWAIITLVILIVAVVNAVIGLTSKKEFTDKSLRISLFALIVTHIQLIIGLITFFTSASFSFLRENVMGAVMKDATARLFIVEHPLMMILAVVFLTIGFSKQKNKKTDFTKFKTIANFYGIALLLVLSRIPWSQWLN